MNWSPLVVLTAVCLCFAVGSDEQFVEYRFPAHDDSLMANVSLNEINTRAYRNFLRSYGFSSYATWRKSPFGYTVRFFTTDSVLHIVTYTIHGRFCDAHLYYNGSNAPPRIRQKLLDRYGQSSILFVSQLDDGVKSIYDVGLIEKEDLRIVEIKGNEIETIELLTR